MREKSETTEDSFPINDSVLRNFKVGLIIFPYLKRQTPRGKLTRVNTPKCTYSPYCVKFKNEHVSPEEHMQ